MDTRLFRTGDTVQFEWRAKQRTGRVSQNQRPSHQRITVVFRDDFGLPRSGNFFASNLTLVADAEQRG